MSDEREALTTAAAIEAAELSREWGHGPCSHYKGCIRAACDFCMRDLLRETAALRDDKAAALGLLKRRCPCEFDYSTNPPKVLGTCQDHARVEAALRERAEQAERSLKALRATFTYECLETARRDLAAARERVSELERANENLHRALYEHSDLMRN